MKTVFDSKSINLRKPIRDIEDALETISDDYNVIATPLMGLINEWIHENTDLIKKELNTSSSLDDTTISVETNCGFVIGKQEASRDINNNLK